MPHTPLHATPEHSKAIALRREFVNLQFSFFIFHFSIPRLLKRAAISSLLIGLLLVSTHPASAQSSSLVSIEIASSTFPVRSDAPITIVWKIRSQSPSLIEGKLEVQIIDGFDVLAHAVAEDVVVAAGEQLYRTVLPPVESTSPSNGIIRVTLRGKDQKFGPFERPFSPSNPWKRSFAILVCDPWQGGMSVDKQQLVDRMRIETWNADPNDRSIATIPAHVRPEDLPSDALGLCGFDLALLANEGFSELKESQLRLLLDWVHAGGSLCVVPGEGVLKEYHAQFLSQAGHSTPDNPQFVLESSGRLIPPEHGSDEIVLLRRHGLGRVVMIREKLGPFMGQREPEVRRALAFLWRLRHDKVEEFLNTGKFLVKSDIPTDQPQPGDSDWQSYNRNRNANYFKLRRTGHQLAQLPLQSGDQLLSRLMPRGLQVVPMSLIGIILVVYVILIGPADWFLLGAIKRRKWTWFTFPAVTVALTLATVWLAEWYMTVRDNRRTVTFYDIGEEGKIARSNRFEVLFQGYEGFVKSEATREILNAMTLQRFSSGTWQNYQQTQLQQGEQSRRYTQVPNYVGRVPARYTVEQFVSQWTPQLNRRFSIAPPGASAVDFDWNQFADGSVFNRTSMTANGPPRNELLKKLQEAFGPTVNIDVITLGKRQTLAGDAGVFPVNATPYGLDQYGNPLQQQYQWLANNQVQSSFLEDTSVNGLGGLFDVVSQLSPTGGKDFEDMALHDPSDPEQWLLIVSVDHGDTLELYRKLYRRGN
jgi:hypothetical protein